MSAPSQEEGVAAAAAGDVTHDGHAAQPAAFLPRNGNQTPLPGTAALRGGESHQLPEDGEAPSVSTTRASASAVGLTADILLRSPASSPAAEALLRPPSQPQPSSLAPGASSSAPGTQPAEVLTPDGTANVPEGGKPGGNAPTPPEPLKQAPSSVGGSSAVAAPLSPLRFASPAVTPPASGATLTSAPPQNTTNTTTTTINSGGAQTSRTAAAGKSSRSGRGARRRSSTTSNRAGRGNTTRRDNFGGTDGVSYENFFFHNEDAATFGIGTVGLFSTRAKPVTQPAGGGPHAPSKNTAHATRDSRHRHGRHRHGEAATTASPRRTSLSDSHSLTPSAAGGGGGAGGAAVAGSGGVPQYYIPACYASPAVDGVTAWEQRRANYRRWRRENLEGSSYYRLSKIGDAMVSMSGAGGGERADGVLDDGAPSLTNLLAPLLFSTEEQQQMEHRRLRALQAERAARTHSRANDQVAYEGEVLLQRVRKLRGEAVDMPDSYLRMTYPDPTTLTGYAETVHAGGAAATARKKKNHTFPGPYRSTAAAGYLENPQRAVRDHHRAVLQHRVNMQQSRLDREAQRAEAAEKQRHDLTAEVADSHARSTAYMASWMQGRPRVSRAREAERHAQQEADQRAVDAWNRAAKIHEREAYSVGVAQDAAAAAARQQDLRARVVAARSFSRRGVSQPASRPASPHDRMGSPLPHAAATVGTASVSATAAGVKTASGSGLTQRVGMAATAAPLPVLPRTTAAGDAASPRPTTAARTATPGRPTTPAPPPSQVVGPTSTNFFNEVKLWTQEFPSPNTIPANGADAAHRRTWKAELDDAQLRFNREATQRQREDIPRRVQEARDRAFEGHWHQAEQERLEKRGLASRRADLNQAEVDAATQLRMGVQEELQLAQQQRLVQAAERFTEVQFFRQQSKQREMVLRSIEAEELHQLRATVSSASAVHRA